MGQGSDRWGGLSPTEAPLYIQRDDHWRHFDNSVNAISFGFVATAILISMFLVMAIFERFLRTTSSSLTPSGHGGRNNNHGSDIESQLGFSAKLAYPSPKVPVKAREVSVLMPGEVMPTFIAQPAPVPCPQERLPWPSHHHVSFPKFISNMTSRSN